jgi:hypothetical protein
MTNVAAGPSSSDGAIEVSLHSIWRGYTAALPACSFDSALDIWLLDGRCSLASASLRSVDSTLEPREGAARYACSLLVLAVLAAAPASASHTGSSASCCCESPSLPRAMLLEKPSGVVRLKSACCAGAAAAAATEAAPRCSRLYWDRGQAGSAGATSAMSSALLRPGAAYRAILTGSGTAGALRQWAVSAASPARREAGGSGWKPRGSGS